MGKSKLYLLVLLILLVLGFAGYWMILPDQNEVTTGSKKHSSSKESSPTENLPKASIPLPDSVKSAAIYFEPEFEKTVKFKIPGKIEAYTWKKGDQFKKGDLLFMLNNETFFNEVSSLKAQLKAELETNLRNVRDEKTLTVWQHFYSGIEQVNLLPEAPALNYENQINKRVFELINRIRTLESQVFDYFYLAPFDGEFKSINSKSKSTGALAVIYPTRYILLSTKIHKDELAAYQKTGLGIDQAKITSKKQAGPDSLMVYAKVKYHPKKHTFYNRIATVKI